MANESDPNPRPGWWHRLWHRPKNKWLLGIPLGGFAMFVVGSAFVIGSQVAIHYTGTNEFCGTACHSHAAFVDPEWKDSPHYKNPTGMQAGCHDCHIPKEYPDLLFVKTKSGILDSYGEFVTHVISTREKFEANRARLAEEVWAYMKSNDSRECRSCHKDKNFILANQKKEAAKAHVEGPKEGKTCIDCHKGIAHKTPDEVAEEERAKASNQPSVQRPSADGA
jgi:nitrate/TMAO reductase-like tetraheme cytochrome c subunit